MPGNPTSRIRQPCVGQGVGGEELFRRRERLNGKAELPQQVGQRLAHRFAVVDDRNQWTLLMLRSSEAGGLVRAVRTSGSNRGQRWSPVP